MRIHRTCGLFGCVLALCLLAACGGGNKGSDDDSTPPDPTEPTTPTDPDPEPGTPTEPGVAIPAATGGSVTSEDGRLVVTFPAGAFTADTTVTLTSVDAPSLPSGGAFAAIRPVAGSFVKLAFAGGQIKPGASFTVGLAPASTTVRLAKSEGGSGSSVAVVQCADQTTSAAYIGTNPDGYGSSPGFMCGPGENDGCTIGLGEPVDMRTNAPLGLKATDGVGDEALVAIANGVNGRTAAYYSQQPPLGDATLHLVIAGGAGTFEEFDSSGGQLLAVDDGGLALRAGDNCTVTSVGTLVSSASPASLQPQAMSAALLQAGESCPSAYSSGLGRNGLAAVWAGNGWLVHTSFGTRPALYWVSPTGQITRQFAYTYQGPTGETSPQTVHDMAADAVGNAWLAVGTNNANSVACGGYRDTRSHQCISLIHVTPTATGAAQRELGNLRDSDQRGDVSLAMDGAGAAYLSAKLQAETTYTRLTISKYSAAGDPEWSVPITDTWDLKPGGIVFGDNGLVYAYGDGNTEDANGSSTFGAFVYQLDAATGAVQAGTHYGDFSNALHTDQTRLLRSARLFSADANGDLTVLGVYRGELDGVGSGDRRGSGMDNAPNEGLTIYARRFAIN